VMAIQEKPQTRMFRPKRNPVISAAPMIAWP
jgi:hypothetical protein